MPGGFMGHKCHHFIARAPKGTTVCGFEEAKNLTGVPGSIIQKCYHFHTPGYINK